MWGYGAVGCGEWGSRVWGYGAVGDVGLWGSRVWGYGLLGLLSLFEYEYELRIILKLIISISLIRHVN